MEGYIDAVDDDVDCDYYDDYSLVEVVDEVAAEVNGVAVIRDPEMAVSAWAQCNLQWLALHPLFSAGDVASWVPWYASAKMIRRVMSSCVLRRPRFLLR